MKRQVNRITARGKELEVWNRLMIKEVSAPNIIFKLPIKAEARPAFFSNGSNESAVVLGF